MIQQLNYMHCLLYCRRFTLLCIKRNVPYQLQINCHFHCLNFPTVSSLLHIRKIPVQWFFLQKSGPRIWVVGATLALKQNLLAGTLQLLVILSTIFYTSAFLPREPKICPGKYTITHTCPADDLDKK